MTSAGRIPDLAMSHVGFHVRDVAVMEDFYTRVLGFTVTDRGQLGAAYLVFMSRNPAEHHQVVLISGRPADEHFNIINQLSFRVPDIAALRHFANALVGEKASELRPVTHGNAISLYFRDPEGNRIELFLDTPWYCEQPCREPVDFSKSDAEILAETERLARALPGFKSREAWMAEVRAKIEARQG
jgi:catechol-2,3-dioxygenase